jgi:hypothetical protein
MSQDVVDKIKALYTSATNTSNPISPIINSTTGVQTNTQIYPTTGAGTSNNYTSAQTLSQGYYATTAITPSLPIKLNIRELIKLLRVLEADKELKGIIQKFQPFIGVEV